MKKLFKYITILIAISCFGIPSFAQDRSQYSRETLTTIQPSAELRQAISKFMRHDNSANFSLFRGYVDSFSSQPKNSIPDYALKILEQANQSSEARNPRQEIVSNKALQSFGEGNNLSQDLPYPAENSTKGSLESNPYIDDKGGYAGSNDTQLSTRSDNNGSQNIWYNQDNQRLAKRILAAFLTKYSTVFNIPEELIEQNLPNLELVNYGVGKYFRRAEFKQFVGETPLLNGKTIVLFDLNWNVILISRQLVTREKLAIERVGLIEKQAANEKSQRALKQYFKNRNAEFSFISSILGIDAIRGLQAWQIELAGGPEEGEYTVTINASTGDILNISDNTNRDNDAKVRHWEYEQGDMDKAYQVVESNFYTYDDNTLVHDFFYLVNDNRNDGGTGNCSETTIASSSTPDAYLSITDSDYIRPTRRNDLDFSLWSPKSETGSFGESHVYYWARNYMQWQKQALIDLGVLTDGDFNNFTKVLIIVNACRKGAGVHITSFTVSTFEDKGEGLPVILLPDFCRKGNANCIASDYSSTESGNLISYEDSGGYSFPGVIDHELNHFILSSYFNVKSRWDCGISQELKFFHEGGLGRTLPQMYWNHYYKVGYSPTSTNQLFRSNGISGRPHDDAASLNHLDNFLCEDGEEEPYDFGGVVAQPMWEIYHGKDISNNTNIARPAEDLGMIKAMYYAADLTSASSYQDRWELANRFMEFWELFSSAKSTTKSDWCDVWGHHGLDNWISYNYCR